MMWMDLKVRSKQMNIFGHPIEIWFASFVAVMFKLKMTSKWTVIETVTTISIALFSGVILYIPVTELLNLSASWHVPMAILISLTAENLMKNVVDLSSDSDFFKDWIRYIVNKKTGMNVNDNTNTENDKKQ